MASAGTFTVIAKRGYVPVSDDNDEVVPGNFGALKKGLEALLAEDSRDDVRARNLWAEARELLIQESQDDEGAGGQGSVQMADNFAMDTFCGNWSEGV